MPALIISLDFELFWGVADVRTVSDYGANIAGVRLALPRILALFRDRDIRATWATVGMLMCAGPDEWRSTRPALMPTYDDPKLSNYRLDSLVRAHPDLFFAPDLVQCIADTPGQEVATHTYSHFYCNAPGATPAQFAADLDLALSVGRTRGFNLRSIVFPRNQMPSDFLAELNGMGIAAYRGNPSHWLYRHGHHVPGGLAGRALRLVDTWLPVSRSKPPPVSKGSGLVNLQASAFLRPWSRQTAALEPLRLRRLLGAMTTAARQGQDFHLWWHPHNFGVNTEINLAFLARVLDHHQQLRDRHGVRSLTMAQAAAVARSPH